MKNQLPQHKFYAKDNRLFDQSGNEILADEKGIIEVEIDNRRRKFIKEKFIQWIQSNHIAIPAPKKRKTRITKERKQRIPKEKIIRAKKWERLNPTVRKGTSIVAIKDGVQYGPYISQTACAKALNMSKSQVSKCMLSGKTSKGYQFKEIKN